ncbi:predicted protein [Naegleria gruberi]|uniref:Predicted protein n=1 Tax=Naegleria gruberi TaxID=5762 RepID=D2VER7_NAEGR|nr:uncharacterized protein NAEGRDRAFT_67368 [Naegleria gruberi]EFC44648.1 predicted protein [Naegleria gruberi]|eukprot:XP_002677392.1 predicted protein [Naegleria gruberi strain NEG-M]
MFKPLALIVIFLLVTGNYLKGCVYSHNANRSTQYGSTIGENIYIESGYTTGSSIDRGINSWFNEYTDYNFKTNTCGTGKVCGHYTQLIWAKSTEIGCAKHTCSSVQGFKGVTGKPVILVLCNYATAGNYIGQKPYTTAAG